MDLEKIYREQYHGLVGFLTQRVGNRARAEELAQEVFVRAIRHRPRRPRSWLYAVASNLARDEGRRQSVRRRHLRLVKDEASAVEESPHEELERSERRAVARQALKELGERDRQALLMQEAGASYTEIATELGLSDRSVGTTLSRARARLVRAFESRQRSRDDVAR